MICIKTKQQRCRHQASDNLKERFKNLRRLLFQQYFGIYKIILELSAVFRGSWHFK